MAAIILLDADQPYGVEIIKDGDGENLVFDSVEHADSWTWENSKRIGGSTFRIIDLDD